MQLEIEPGVGPPFCTRSIDITVLRSAERQDALHVIP